MRMLAREILSIAKEVLVEMVIIVERSDDVESSAYNSVHSELQRMADRIRKNEGVDVVMNRKDTADIMEIGIGFSGHEAKKAILDEFVKLAKKVSKRNGIESVSIDYL